MIPLFVLAIGIAIFFALVQKNTQKATIGCGSFVAVAMALGIIAWFLDFVARLAFIFILLAMGLCFGALILFMVYSPSTPLEKLNPNNPHDDVNTTFYNSPWQLREKMDLA